jgi:hypothetical protein
MSRGLLALMLMLAAAPALAARDALSAIDGCIGKLDPELDVGYEKIAARCPDLTPSLEHSPWAAWLPSEWNKPQNTLSAPGLRQLRVLIVREAARTTAKHEPRIERLAPVLAALKASAGAHRSGWQRFKDWLREVLQPGAAQPRRGWLRRLIDSIGLSGALLDAITYGALALVALLAGVIVANELRAGGVLRALRRGGAARTAALPTAAAPGWPDIEDSAPAQRPRVLLEAIAARLIETQRLPPARALTTRELVLAARLTDATDRARLAELAAACERVRFAARPPPAQMLGAALARGRELLAGLEAARA